MGQSTMTEAGPGRTDIYNEFRDNFDVVTDTRLFNHRKHFLLVRMNAVGGLTWRGVGVWRRKSLGALPGTACSHHVLVLLEFGRSAIR